MPIRIPPELPARKVLASENIFVMDDNRACSQHIRPLRILIVNLMPTKIDTETQFCRLLGNTALQVTPEFLSMTSRVSTHVAQSHLETFYHTFDEIRDRKYDGMIITGAPVEHLAFEDVEYWPELCRIMEWSKTNVYSTIHICWGAQAALYYHYGIPKYNLPEKLFGVYRHKVTHKGSILFRGFDDSFNVPHSRHTTVHREDILAHPELKILAESDLAGVYAVSTNGGRQIYLMGHAEYDPLTLHNEYTRDKNKGLPIHVPRNYYPDDNDTQVPTTSWRSSAHMLFANWLNYFVYQSTPYDINAIGAEQNTEDGLTVD